MKKLSRLVFCIRPETPLEKVGELFRALSRRVDVYLDPDSSALWQGQLLPAPVLPHEQWAKMVDAAVVIGGDGTLLKIAPQLADWGLPVLGVNRGRLGFMTDIPFEHAASEIERVCEGHYQLENRALLDVAVLESNGLRLYSQSGLNDGVINAGAMARMIDFEVWVDERFVYRQRADGLIVSTPTGSTAYALSAGGPIIAPELNVFLLVPMFPHSLSCRPLLVSSSSVVSVHMQHAAHSHPALSVDGGESVSLSLHAHVRFSKKLQALQLIHPEEHDYFRILRDKLHWSSLPNYTARASST